MEKKKVLLALSGGVDSSVSALLLREQGYEVIAAIMDTGFGHAGSEAAEVAAQLGIEHYIIDVSKDFIQNVISNFMEEYAAARTPNPCVICNPTVKFAFMQRLAEELNISYLATGHYARVGTYQNRYAVKKATFAAKDQSYMLYRLDQQLLSRLLFPLGEYQKTEIRRIATDYGLCISDKPDSQDICFIPDGDYRAFLHKQGLKSAEGNFVDKDGRILGRHKGIANYTVGQRKGLGIALGYPAFVCTVDAEKNQVVLGVEEDLLKKSCTVENLYWQGLENLRQEKEVTVKLRYKSKPVPAVIIPKVGNVEVRFEQAQKAVTLGQSAVFYDEDTVLGGGFIK